MLPESGDFFSVMYHYVRPEEPTELRYKSVKAFERQLDFLENTYGLVNQNDWEKFRNTGYKPKGALLTFDDGLKDHYQFVLPILKKRNIFGIFYTCTNPLSRFALPVHLTHYLLANYNAKDIWDALTLEGLPRDYSLVFDSKSRLAYLTHDHSILEKELKRLINWCTNDIGQNSLLLEIFSEFTNLSQSQFVSKWYLNESEILEISNSGFEIGSHTCTHKLLSNLSEMEIEYELSHSKSILIDICGANVESFCFPFGGNASYNPYVLKKLYEFGYTESFSVNPHPIKNKFLELDKRFELPRYDCNLF